MSVVLNIVAGILLLVNIACLIMVLIKLYQEKGLLHGILGFVCGLYTFIWGWMNVSRLNIRNIMVAWSVCIVLYVIFYSGAMAMAQ